MKTKLAGEGPRINDLSRDKRSGVKKLHGPFCPAENGRTKWMATTSGKFRQAMAEASRPPCHANLRDVPEGSGTFTSGEPESYLDSFLSPCKDLHYANSPQYPHPP